MSETMSSEDELTTAIVEPPQMREFLSDLSDEDPSFRDEAANPPSFSTNATDSSVDAPLRPQSAGPLQSIENASIDSSSLSDRGEIKSQTPIIETEDFLVADASAQSICKVNIEVALSWKPRDERAAFQHVEVPEWEEDIDGDGSMSQGRKRQRAEEDDEYQSDDVEMDDSPPRRARRDIDYSTGLPRRENGRQLRPRTASQDIHISDVDGSTYTGLRPRRKRQTQISFSRASTRASTHLDDDPDELAGGHDDTEYDSNFAMVHSDIVGPTKKRRRGRFAKTQFRDSSIEFEARRRSSRVNKNTKSMNYTIDDDDDDDFGYQEEKAPTAPKVTGVREIFSRSEADDFIAFHRPICEVCNGPDKAINKGVLIHCQGCSNSYHRYCIGLRSTRDHCVTKVGPDSFVLQCRFCVGNFGTAKRDARANGAPRGPGEANCQACNTKGSSCSAFSTRKTPKQEAKLRLENDGVDPITSVPPELLDNAKNVLFRCSMCRRGFHWEHLSHPTGARDPARDDPDNIRKHRLDEYSITWLCKECMDVDGLKAQTFVAWRPLKKTAFDPKNMDISDLGEDQLEYLVKWEGKSYRHCTWMPGAWVYGYASAAMRAAFLRRNDSEFADEADEAGRNLLLKHTLEEAIPDTYITPDVLLSVHTAPRSSADEAKYKQMPASQKILSDLSRIHHITKVFLKFEGLGYDEAVWDEPPAPDNEAVWASFHAAYQEYLNGKHFAYEPARNIRERVQEFRNLDFQKDIKVDTQPPGLRRGTLMAYQLEGMNWLLWNYRLERSVILADEMGLGKTVQVVALLTSLVQDKPKTWPFLIVVPNPTCANWRREIKKWAPELRVVAYYGGKASQDLAYQYELFPSGNQHMKAHIVIMSYDSAQDDRTRTLFKSVKWAGLVVDEAQRLKNDENLLYKALKAMNIAWALLLTGTPLQNNKRELFNLLQFIDPREMDAAALDAEFQDLTPERVQELHKKIRPYFLRRTKAQVLTFLPPMAQVIVPVSMTVLQEKLCKSIMEKNPQLIRSIFARGKLKSNEKTGLNNILMQLRKCLCHPFIYSRAIEDVNASTETMKRNLVEASSKLLLLQTMLPILKERGHRVLIFSQFLEQLTILEDFLNSLLIRYERLDGSLSSIEKQKRIDAFNDPDSELFCMLLSTRAGGVGINLATADTVIILDPDFNPHQDIQALSRAHRIGQKKKVLCFQLMTQDSPEEKILQIGRKKMALDHVLIESMDEEGDNSNDMESILKHGAAALFSEDKKKDAITYDRAAVEKLLDRSATEETNAKDGSTEGAFAFAKVWAHDGTLATDVDAVEHTVNVGAWDDILKEREAEARREAMKHTEVLGRGGRRRQVANYSDPKYGFEDPQDGPGGQAGDSSEIDEDFQGGDGSDEETSGDDGDQPARLQEVQGTKPKKTVRATATPKRAVARKQSTPKPTGKQVAASVANIQDGSRIVAGFRYQAPDKLLTMTQAPESTPNRRQSPYPLQPTPVAPKPSLVVTLTVPTHPRRTEPDPTAVCPTTPMATAPQGWEVLTPETVQNSPTEQIKASPNQTSCQPRNEPHARAYKETTGCPHRKVIPWSVGHLGEHSTPALDSAQKR